MLPPAPGDPPSGAPSNAPSVVPADPADAPGTRAPSLAAVTDLTLLKADATRDDIRELCAQAVTHGCRTVCVNPAWVAEAVAACDGRLAVCSVAGFPLGATTTDGKVAEASAALADGAAEVDVVSAVGLLVGGWPRGAGIADAAQLLAFQVQLAAVAQAVRSARGPVPTQRRALKVILETCLLDERQKIAGALLAAGAGADFVKTSTGFSTGGATVADVELLAATLGRSPPGAGIKASGGIRDALFARELLAAGATRLGASSVAMLRES
jgi:deoxyribose-phosphate aldolase